MVGDGREGVAVDEVGVANPAVALHSPRLVDPELQALEGVCPELPPTGDGPGS